MDTKNAGKKSLTKGQRETLLGILEERFEKNLHLHKGIEWKDVKARLETNDKQQWSLNEMERTGGQPDVVGRDDATGNYLFFDCSIESPSGRRKVCFDRAGLESRKEHRPENNAIDMACEMGVELLTEDQYRHLQELGKFDLKTSSWIQTPTAIRSLGGALFCDRRYDHVFTYHNGAQSYYTTRGFRACLQV